MGITIHFRWKNFSICFAISLGALAYGYLAAIISTTMGKPAFLMYMGLGDESGEVFHDKENLQGAITSVFQAGAIIGCLCSCYITDTYGRKAGMVYCSMLSILGAAGLTGSPNIGAFITFRFFAGAGSWGYTAVAPVYCSELAPPSVRGFFVGMIGAMLGLGYATANYFGLAFYYASDPTVSWRAPLGLQLFFPLMILCLLPFVPESPRYFLMMDKKDEAWSVIEKLHDDPTDSENEFARREFYQMAQQAAYDRTINSSWVELFRRSSYRKRVLFGMFLMILCQSTGELVLNQYEPKFYAELGYNTLQTLILQTGRNSIAFLGNLVGAFIIDRFGRRKLLLTGLGGCIVCLCIEAAMVAQYADEGTNRAGLGVGVAALYVFLLFFALGMDAASWVVLSEIFPNFIRAKGYAVAVATKSAINLVYLQVTPMGFARLGWRYFMVYVSISVVGFGLLYWAAPETKGIPLEEVAALFGDKDDIMVYQDQIHVDESTRKIVVVDERRDHTGMGQQTVQEHTGREVDKEGV